jgi:hypothetical protein
LFKELVINEEDVDLYRSYLIKHDTTFDVYRFDSDDRYKMLMFYRINPLVSVEQSARVDRMLRGSQYSQVTIHFTYIHTTQSLSPKR